MTVKIKIDVTRYVTGDTYASNRPITGEVVTVLDLSQEARGLCLIPTYSRVLVAHSIHELVATDEIDKKPGETVNRVAFLAFVEILQSGCAIVGETVEIGEETIGSIIGFDETHEPNHMNIVIGVNQRRTGRQLQIDLGTAVRFRSRISDLSSPTA